MSPIAFVQRLRVERAIHLLQTTNASMSEISARVGYADASALRRLVHREARASPRELRRRASKG
jgi:transcriptional regulator GlxA family with amidase domain